MRRYSPQLLISAGVILALAVTAFISLLWLPYSIDDTSGERLSPPSADHLFGTDKLGRDLLSRMMVGARIALSVGASSVAIAALIGVTFGIIAGFAQHVFDESLATFLDIVIAFPTLLVAMLIVAARGASFSSVILAISLGLSSVIARLTRLLVKGVLTKDFITASRASGTSWLRIVFIHIFPNIWPTLSVTLAMQFGLAGLAEASLSYLGLGSPPPNSSWGSILQESQQSVLTSPLAAVIPGTLLILLVLAINTVADELREHFDPTRGGGK